METVIEIIHHTEYLRPALQVELFSYVCLVSLTILLGICNVLLKRC